MGLTDASDGPITFRRRAARAVLTNDEHQVAVMYFTNTGSYKLPGGGIDEGEETIAALHREIREETGYEIHDISEIGIVDEYRYYCGMRQLSYCYTARIGAFVGTNYTENEAATGMELRWAESIQQAIQWIESGHMTDEDGSATGLAMMKLRDSAILSATITT